jgi:Clp amino terminal domain, pathogenicity island component
MFERYTEKARRVIFFARYEASQFGSLEIASEHLLLGLLREDRSLQRWVARTNFDEIRQQITAQLPKLTPKSVSIDLPLSEASKQTLLRAAGEADRLNHKHIGTEHLFLALLDAESELPAKILLEGGADAVQMRVFLEAQVQAEQTWGAMAHFQRRDLYGRGHRAPSGETIEIHGTAWNADHVRDAVSKCHTYTFHWHKTVWKPHDIVINRNDGSVSFDLALAQDSGNFNLVRSGWTRDHCVVCRWELCESSDDAEHGTGYTNGQDWLCTECFERFWNRDYFSSSHSDIT